MNNIGFAVRFSRKFSPTEIDIIAYLNENNNTFSGNYYDLSEILGRVRSYATNLRKVCLALQDKGILNITSERGNSGSNTTLQLLADWTKEV